MRASRALDGRARLLQAQPSFWFCCGPSLLSELASALLVESLRLSVDSSEVLSSGPA